ncbi:MAG TPA: glycosyltransferase family 39 protein, partial [Solirubrobacteraceae bacterium]|nr:glycosyltransferase family 39 protein [Solirubrobacteraceae bacterium]
ALTPVALAVLVAASAWLRTRALGAAYWMDEGISVGIASHPLTAIPALLRQDGSPPLYYVLLHLWIGVAGPSETATHALSVLFAVACVPAAWAVARMLWGERAGWAAALLAALSPPLTYHAQETRMYPLVALLSLLVAGSFAGAVVARGRPRLAWVHAAALTLLAYTHNWFVFLAAAEAIAVVALLVVRWGERRALLRAAAIAFGIPALLYLPWVPTLLFQSAHTGAPWSGTPTLGDLWKTRTWLLAGPVALTALGIAVITAAVLLWQRRGEWAQLVALAWLTGGTLMLAFAANQLAPAWAARYAVVLLGPLLLLGALALSRSGVAGVVAALAIALAWYHQPAYHSIEVKSNARAIGHRVAARLAPGDLVIDAIPESVPVARYYLGPRLRYASTLGRVTDPGVMDWRDAPARMRAQPARPIARMADALPVGGRVALLRPVDHGHPSANAWKEMIRERARRLSRLLGADPSLRHVKTLHPGFHGPKTTLRAVIYERVAG